MMRGESAVYYDFRLIINIKDESAVYHVFRLIISLSSYMDKGALYFQSFRQVPCRSGSWHCPSLLFVQGTEEIKTHLKT